MAPKIRLAMLLSILAASAGLTFFDDQSGAVGIAEPLPRAEKNPVSGKNPLHNGQPQYGSSMIGEIQPRTPTTGPADAFAPRNWTPPPPPPAAPAPPSAPPLPFTYLGKQLEDGLWRVFLGRQDSTYVVKEKDDIEGTYQVESIQPPTMILTYKPLQERQTLAIGESQ